MSCMSAVRDHALLPRLPTRVAFLEVAVAGALFVIAGYVWLHPASKELLAGNASVMVGDNSDSVTNVWQYQLVVDTLRREPLHLFWGALFSDQMVFPAGQPVFIPYSERLIVLLLAPFMRVDLMPTAVAWSYSVLAGLSMYVCGRSFGWSRLLSFSLALAWAVNPYMRARAEVHIALDAIYFAPMAVTAVRVLAGAPPPLGWARRTELLVSALLFLGASCTAHYYLMLLVGFAPMFALLYAVLLPKGTKWKGATLRLAIAVAPSLLLVATTAFAPLPAREAAIVARGAATAQDVRAINRRELANYGAEPIDFAGGDVRFGDRDVNPLRAAVTRTIRKEARFNFHERTNGIRWVVLAGFAALVPMLSWPRLRRRLTRDQCRLGAVALLVAFIAFELALGLSEERFGNIERSPILYFTRLFPAFRIANRIGILIHFAALVGAGIVLHSLSAGRRQILAGAFGLCVLVEYLPLHPVILAPVAIRRDGLAAAANGGACGAGISVPYLTHGFEAEDYYLTATELRGTSCKLIHSTYSSREDDQLRERLSSKSWDEASLARIVTFARCTRASWAIFRLDAPEAFRNDFCARLGWSFVTADSCRGDASELGPARDVRECVP